MPTDPFKKVRPGERLSIPASTYNAFVDAARANRTGDSPGGIETGTAISRELFKAQLVPVKNMTAANLPRFGLLGIAGPMFDSSDFPGEFQRRPALKGEVATAQHAGRFVVALEPIAAGEVGMACAAGTCVAQVTIDVNPSRFAEITDTGLKSTPSGSVTILWHANGTGLQWALVRLGGGGAADVQVAKIKTAPAGGAGGLFPSAIAYDVEGLNNEDLGPFSSGLQPVFRASPPNGAHTTPAAVGSLCLIRYGDFVVGPTPGRRIDLLSAAETLEIADCATAGLASLLAIAPTDWDQIVTDKLGDLVRDKAGELIVDKGGDRSETARAASSIVLNKYGNAVADKYGDVVRDKGPTTASEEDFNSIVTDKGGDIVTDKYGQLVTDKTVVTAPI